MKSVKSLEILRIGENEMNHFIDTHKNILLVIKLMLFKTGFLIQAIFSSSLHINTLYG